MDRFILMPIKPRLAEEVLSGFKRFELRVGSGARFGDRVSYTPYCLLELLSV